MRHARNATPTELDETWVWEAFRALRVEGTPLYPTLVETMTRSAFFAEHGPTLEVGGGDAHLWRAGGDPLLRRALDSGGLTITDADAALVERCRADDFFRRESIELQRADVAQLPFADAAFARALVVHVLHWCGAPLGVTRAVGEIARVLRPSGRALVVTVDERVHMRELYALLERARDAVLERGIEMPLGIPACSPRVLPFCAGNALAYLREAFRYVEPFECVYAHIVEPTHPTLGVHAEEFVGRYVRTLPFVKAAIAEGSVPEAFFEELSRIVREEIATAGCIRFSRRDVMYDAREPC